MSVHHRWIAALLALSALTACATTASTPHAYSTGSRVALPVDPHTGLPENGSPMQTVSHDQLMSTGQSNAGSALRQLVPSLH
jgi:hypothetical protein